MPTLPSLEELSIDERAEVVRVTSETYAKIDARLSKQRAAVAAGNALAREEAARRGYRIDPRVVAARVAKGPFT